MISLPETVTRRPGFYAFYGTPLSREIPILYILRYRSSDDLEGVGQPGWARSESQGPQILDYRRGPSGGPKIVDL